MSSDTKGKISTGIYAAAIAVSFIHSWIAFSMYFIVLLIWLMPDKRIERKLTDDNAAYHVS